MDKKRINELVQIALPITKKALYGIFNAIEKIEDVSDQERIFIHMLVIRAMDKTCNDALEENTNEK